MQEYREVMMVKLKVEQISKDIYWNGGFFFILVCHKCILVIFIYVVTSSVKNGRGD